MVAHGVELALAGERDGEDPVGVIATRLVDGRRVDGHDAPSLRANSW